MQQQTNEFAIKQTDEWKQLPEHKWIKNLYSYVAELVTRNRDCYQYGRTRSRWSEINDEMERRSFLLKKYENRITKCEKATKCFQMDCPFYHSKNDRLIIQQNKKNKEDYEFYQDKFFNLLDKIEPFLMNDLASIVRDYCCVQTFVLTEETLRYSDSCDSWKPATAPSLFYYQGCDGCYYIHCRHPWEIRESKPWFKLIHKNKKSFHWFHQHCGNVYLGLNRKQNLHGWVVEEYAGAV